MADFGDEVQLQREHHLARSLQAARVPVPAGAPGECEECGEHMPPLVDGRCGFCRDGRTRNA